jgi:hypothetical protein
MLIYARDVKEGDKIFYRGVFGLVTWVGNVISGVVFMLKTDRNVSCAQYRMTLPTDFILEKED